MSRSRPRLALQATTTLALAVAGLAVAGVASANPAGTGLVIDEVYLNGGSAGATYTNKYVEIYNPTAASVDLTGMSVQYRSPTGTGNASTSVALTGTVGANDYYVLTGSSNGANGAAVPNADQASTINPGGGGGTLFLATGTAAVNPGTPAAPNPAIVDLYGYGTSNMYEGTVGPVASVTTSAERDANGTDTDVNSADFAAGAPTPGTATGSAPPPVICTGTAGADPTIAQIQGTDTGTSPCVGKVATTTGVVTAAYPSGGFFGYVIQTDGTGTGTDATPGASDAVYVYQPSGNVTATIGDLVQVTGSVSEFSGLTELTVAAADLHDQGPAPTGVTTLEIAYPTTDAGREAHESELLEPTNQFTVTDNYSTNQYGEIGLATGDTQLPTPTDLYPAADTTDINAVTSSNAARLVTLDDGKSTNFLTAPGNATPMSWLTTDNPVRIGSAATLKQPVILDYRNSLWKFQPTQPVNGEGTDVATFSDTRRDNLAPQPVGGNLKLATFNVLNYFNTTGVEWAAMPGNSCTYYKDRAGDPVTDNVCSGNGPRGAAESSGGTDLTAPTADVERQRVKEVRAINTSGADIVSLEEIENSVALGISDRDDALKTLVNALNADSGKPHPWAFAPSPSAADLPPTAEQDVIRTAFIYNPDKVDLVGASKVLSDQSGPGQPFENAREPLAQEFKRKGALDSDGFAVIVNHLKSKGSGVDDGTGQGNANPDRVAQAKALVSFATAFEQARGTDKVFLVGDFNSYTQEDPMQVLYGAGYLNQASDHPNDSTYEFGGMTGSLDHVLANPAAAGMVTGRDVWQIDAEESVGFEYSRYNYNATSLYQPNQFRASDHNPEVVGLDAPLTQTPPPATSATTTKVSPETATYGHGWHATVNVTSASADVPTGTVTLTAGGKTLGTASLSSGSATLAIGGTALKPGHYTMTASYAGDGTHAASTGTALLKVKKASPRLHITKHPHAAKVHRTREVLTIRATAAMQTVHGRIKVSAGGHVYRARLVHGKAVVTLDTFTRPGRQRIVVRYLGNRLDTAVTKVTHLRVHR
jgi:predicted extracellular nuclease